MIRHFFRNLQSAWWEFLRPEFQEPDHEDVSPAALAQWVAGHKHPEQCNRGCQCKASGGD